MDISAKEWALALTMIEKLRLTCDAHGEMFGQLLYHLVNGRVLTKKQGEALNAEWNQCYGNLDEFDKEFSVQGEERVHITETGALKGQVVHTVDRAFDGLYADALDRLSSGEENDEG